VGTSPVELAAFFDVDTTGQAQVPGKGTGQTHAQMTSLSTFAAANWSIADGWQPDGAGRSKWGICPLNNAGYPFLQWFAPNDPCTVPTPPSPPSPPAPDTPVVTPAQTGGSPAAGPAEQPNPVRAVLMRLQRIVSFRESGQPTSKSRARLRSLARSLPAAAQDVEVSVMGYARERSRAARAQARLRAQQVADMLRALGVTGNYSVNGAGSITKWPRRAGRVRVALTFMVPAT